MVYLPAVELDDDLAIAVVIDFLELADVACKKYMLAGLLREFKHAFFSQTSEDV